MAELGAHLVHCSPDLSSALDSSSSFFFSLQLDPACVKFHVTCPTSFVYDGTPHIATSGLVMTHEFRCLVQKNRLPQGSGAERRKCSRPVQCMRWTRNLRPEAVLLVNPDSTLRPLAKQRQPSMCCLHIHGQLYSRLPGLQGQSAVSGKIAVLTPRTCWTAVSLFRFMPFLRPQEASYHILLACS